MEDFLHVSIVQEWILPQENETFTKSNPTNPLFYLAKLRKGKMRYLKVGTTTRTIQKRFSSDDYHRYNTIEILYVAELTCDKSAQAACEQVEDLTRCAIRQMKGFTFVPKDRFKYFQLPAELPVVTSFDNIKTINIRR